MAATLRAYVLTGTVTDGRTVALDDALPLASSRVRVIVEPLEAMSHRSYATVLAEIRQRQRQRSHRPPSREQVDAHLAAERASWDA